jgi:hypothetical protein
MWCFDFICQDIGRVLADERSGKWLLGHRGAGFTLADTWAATRRDAAINRALASRGIHRVP